jgi:hypothetical protein
MIDDAPLRLAIVAMHKADVAGVSALLQILTEVEGVETNFAPFHAASRSNCSASDGFELQVYFACPLRIM